MASDNSGRQVDVTFSCSAATASDCNQAGIGTFSVGVSTITYKAEDASGNENVCTFTVTVTAVEFVCPANISVIASPGLNSTSVSWSEPDLTGWDGPTNFTSSSNPGVELLIGTHQVDFQQCFEAYNLNLECSFFVVVLDNEPPQLDDCPADVIIPVSSSANQVHHRWTPPMASDNSAREVDVTFSCLAATASDCNQAGIGTFSVGVSTITYKAEDASGNKNSCTFTVTVKAVEFVCPANISVTASPGLNSTNVSWSEPDLTGWDGPTNFTSSSNPGVELLVGTHRVDFQQYVEAYNLNLECSFFVAVLDNEPPQLDDCPADVIIPVSSSANQVHHRWTPPMASDNSAREVDVTFSCLAATASDCNQAGIGTFSVGVSTITYRAEDASGNTNSCTFTVTVKAVEFVCPANISVTASPGLNSTNVSWSEPDLTGWDGPTNFTSSSNPGVELLIGTHQVDFQQYFEAYNLNLECSFFVVVLDNEPPQLDDCPADVIIPVSSSANQVHHRWTPPMASDNSGRQVDVTFSCLSATASDCDQAGIGTFSVGVSTITYKAEDASGNENGCTFTVTVTAVEFVCPANISVVASPGLNSASVSWSEPDLNGWDGPTNFTSSSNPGVELLIGTHQVDFQQYFEAYNLNLECSFFVVVLDNEPPQLDDCPADVIIPVSSSANQVHHRWTPPMASDNSAREVDVTFSCLAATASDCNQAGIGTFSVGVSTITYRAEDASGNTNSCTFTVTVKAVEFVCPANISVTASPGLNSTNVSWSEPDLTGWDGPTNFTSSSNPGVELLIGTHQVDFQQYFEAYNLNLECSFFVVVLDNEPPQLDDCPADVIIPVSSSANQVHHRWTPPMASDNSAREVDVTFSCLAATASDCNQAGIGTFSVGVSTITYKAEDASGNKNSCTFTVTVKAVEFVCPANISVVASPGLNSASVSWSEPDLNGWDGPTNFTSSSNPGVELLIGTHQVDFQQYFEAYNLNLECSFFVVVLDNEPPQLDDCPADVIIPVSSSANQVHHRWTPPMASDNSAREVDVTFSCLSATASDCNQAGIGTFSVGVSTITYKADDASGNTNSCTFTVTVTAVEFVCPANISVIASPGLNSTSVSWSEPDLTGWDGPTNFTSSSNPGVELLIGTHQVDFQQYFEAYNLNLECSFFVVVLDNEPPQLDDCPADVIIPVSSSANQVHHKWTPPMASDNSGRQVDVAFSCLAATASDCDQAGNGTFSVGVSTITYRAEDASGNENGCTFTVTVTVVELFCPATVSALASPGSTSTSVSWSEPDLTGWDGPTNFTSNNIPGVRFLIGTHRVDYQQCFAAYNLHLDCSFFVEVQGQCPTNTTNDGLRWPVAVAGSTAKSVQRCSLTTANAGQAIAVRNCSKLKPPLYFRWDEQETRECGEVQEEVSLNDVVEVEVSKGNAIEVAEFLANQTSESSKEAEDVEVVANILKNIAKAESGDTEVTELVLETVSNVIMSVGPETPDDFKPTTIEASTSSAIVKSVETQISLTLQQEGKVSIRQDSIHVEAVSLDPNLARDGLSFVSVKQSNVTHPAQGSPQEGTLAGTKVETLNSSVIPKDLDVLASARLPGNIIDLLQSPNDNTCAKLQASFLIYADDTLFQSASLREHRGENNSTRKVAGSVVSLTVENAELVNLTEPVVIEFKEESNEVHCVSWDFELEDGVGDWSTDGCALAEVTNKTVVCNCSHATNFAILVDVKGQAPDDKDDTPAKRALDIISQVGAALSIIALAITLIIYLAIRKMRSGKSRQIFINFCFSLFMLYIVFVAGVDNAKGSGGGCVFVAALLHYLTLSTMMWMAVEARNMYVSTVKVFPEDTPRYMLKACLIAWGIPLIVLIITLAAASHHYANEHYCFLEPGLVLYLGLLAPIGLILLQNIITFILVMRSLLKVKEASRSQQISKRLQNAVGISALMGLTWCFGFLAINEAAFAFQLIFCLANSLQGVVVFIMFCARREEVRTTLAPYMKRICCGHECRLPTLHPEKSNESEMVSATAHTLPSAGQTADMEISVTTPQ
ncbi:hyalin-like [Patiria miniata]|uniref:HYR domain-containing protein n=1 Tax=Patiria miniata TaxID=46514 RepID=A0A913ZID6_PATMI|nr:hyalin-like [Patiria miniata]